jgi:hypothetical protein
MSEPHVPQASPSVPTAPGSGGFFQNLIDVYFAPREAFTRILRAPGFVVPLLGHIALAFAFTGVWMNKVDAKEFTKTQIEEAGRWEQIPPERREDILEGAAGRMRIFGWIGPAVFTPLMVIVVAAVLMSVFRFFYASEVSYKPSLAIVAWSFFAVAIVTTPLLLAVFALKGDWNLNPQEVLQASLGLLLDKSTAAKPLWALFTSIDLFSLWLVFLLAAGFAVASRKTTGSALWGVAIPWLVIVALKVGWAAIF